ncbi:hypothetical protein [Nocardioides sp. YIM 152588]
MSSASGNAKHIATAAIETVPTSTPPIPITSDSGSQRSSVRNDSP